MEFTPVFPMNTEEALEDDCNSPFSVEEGMDEYASAPLCHSHGGSPTVRPGPFRIFPSGYPDIHTSRGYLRENTTSSASQWVPTGYHLVDHWISRSHLPEEYGRLIHPSEAYADCAPSQLSPNLALGELESALGRTMGKKTIGPKKKFACPLKQCGVLFARKADRERHFHCVHKRESNKQYDCEVEGCTRRGNHGFTRKDHLREHKRNFHHQIIPKRPKVHRKKHNHS